MWCNEFFPEALKRIRKQYGLTQMQLSMLLEMPRRTLEDYERGASAPPIYLQQLILNGIRAELPNLIAEHPEIGGKAGEAILEEMKKKIPI